MSVTGEKSFSTTGKTAKKSDFTPLPPKVWEAKVRAESVEVRKRSEPGTLPYVNCAFECLDSAFTEGGKNRLQYHKLFLNTKPNEKGYSQVEKANQLVGLARAFGEEFNGGVLEVDYTDPKTSATGKTVIVNPAEVVAWLKAHDGMIIKLKTKMRKASENYPADSEIDYFVEATASTSGI